MMTDAEFAARLRAAVAATSDGYGADPEAAHSAADGILIEALRSLGFDELADAWEQTDKWYA